MVKNKVKRCIPLLLALVVLISCLPVLPVSAASVPAGVYDLSSGFTYFGEFGFSCEGYLYSDGSKMTFDYLYCYWDGDPCLYFGEDEAFYVDYEGVRNFDGGVFYLTAPVSLEGNALKFFQQFLSTYKLIIDGHEEHSHTSPWTSQSIVDSTGTTFECSLCSWELVFTPSGTGTFAGFKDTSGKTYFGQCIFDVDAADLRLTSTYSTPTDPDPGPGVTYTSKITIDGQKFIFTSTTEQPAVLLQVTSSGAILSYGDQILTFTYVGDGSFLGLSFQFTGDPQFVSGEPFTLTGSEYTLFSISDASLPDQLTTTINIYNNAGTQLLYSFKASAADASPRVTVAPSASTITFTVPDQDPVVFSGVYSSFTGLALKPQAISPVVVFGQTLSIGGNPFDSVLDLYCTYESGFADPSDADFVGWLATAVGGFLNFELWPGMSLDQVLWVILVIGILMWFLKVIM